LTFSDEEKIRIIGGMLALTSYLGGKPMHAIWLSQYGTITVQQKILGPVRRIGWKQAARIVETGRVNFTEMGGSVGRPIARIAPARALAPPGRAGRPPEDVRVPGSRRRA